MSLDIVQEVFEDADPYGYIRLSSFPDAYDECAKLVFDKLHLDLTIDQIQTIIWEAFYSYICVGKVGEVEFSLDKAEACVILGDVSRFKGMALNIRHLLYKL
jgi:hypothetical protein